MRSSAVLSVLAVLASAACASASVVEYREIFPNSTSGNLSQSSAGWVVGIGSVTPVGNSSDYGVSNAAGSPADAVPVNSGPTDPWANGFIGHWGYKPSANNYIFYTEEHPIDLASKPLESISWYQGNNGYWDMRVALRIDGAWYLSVNNYPQNTLMGAASSFSTAAEAKSLSMDIASWATLNSNLTQGTLTDLPTTGTLEAYGLVAISSNSAIRFDTFTITVVPEPTAAMAALGAGSALAMRRRRV